MASLNVSLPLVATIAQEIVSLYALWERYKEDAQPESNSSPFSTASTPSDVGVVDSSGAVVTPTVLNAVLRRMREARLTDLNPPLTNRPLVVNKVLERTQAAG